MLSKIQKNPTQVYILTDKVTMRFTPFSKNNNKNSKKNQQNNNQTENTTFSFWSLWPFSRKPKQQQIKLIDENRQKLTTNHKSITTQQLRRDQLAESRLKFACKLSPQHILLGNQHQLDLLCIAGINTNNFLQSEYLWSIKHKFKITHVSTQQKKMNLLVIVTEKRLYIYKYDHRRFSNGPINYIKEIILNDIPKCVEVVKDGSICLFFQTCIEIFIVTDQVRRKFKSTYNFPQQLLDNGSKFNLLIVPQTFQNIVSVFFSQKKNDDQSIFILWRIQYEFSTSEVKNHPIQKVYENINIDKSNLKINNYSKQIFLLNFGNEIFAMKKGYILDSAKVNKKRQPSMLQYIGNDTLMHISQKKIQLYDFSINLIKPFRITIKPKDSIKINDPHPNLKYFKVLQVLGNDYIFIFNQDIQYQKMKKGEFHYYIYITRGLSRSQKMRQLFPQNLKQFKADDPSLLDKCDMAQKMGYSLKEIYLQLWHRSAQSSKQDYSLLIATRDYNTIKDQIMRKLKKSTMAFKQVYNIQQACFTMLSQKVFSSSCTEEALMDYISSHFFKRKLEMFRDLQFIQKYQKQRLTGEESNQSLKITIRQYQQLKAMEIKAQLMTNINQFCHQNMRNLSKNIRILFRNFRFVFRMIYQSLLQQIILNANLKLLDLLKQFPQLLPFTPIESDRPMHIPAGFYDGVWSEITKQQWSQSLYLLAVTTIDSQEIVNEQLIKSINFKRLFLSQHDMVTKSMQQIKQNYQRIKSPHIYYFFIQKLFSYIQDRQTLKKIIDHIQQKYSDHPPNLGKSTRSYSSNDKKLTKQSPSSLPGMPQNIIGKVFLYQKIFRFLADKNILPYKNGRPVILSEFFQFHDYQLIKHFFEKERSIKGLLLKNIKDIYKQSFVSHSEVFNKALLNYFTSDFSQISDLKYMLNRINSQKHNFHRQNQDMYAVLIEALQRKLKIGTNNDIPIQQVLIYLENIPINSRGINSQQMNPTLYELKAIQNINRNSEYLRKSKVNMSIYDILHNPQEVFTKLAQSQINTSHPSIYENKDTFIHFTTTKLAQLQLFSQRIYHDPKTLSPINYKTAIIFIFLCKLCQKLSRIKLVKQLLDSKQLNKYCEFFPLEGLVHFMYKWTLCKNNSFIDNQSYIKQLLTLIPKNSSSEQFISSQLEFAKMLSTQNHQILYPISNVTLCYTDLKQIINERPIQFVLQVPIVRVYEVVRKIEDIVSLQTSGIDEQNWDYCRMNPQSKITLNQVYEIFIIKLLNQNKFKQVIPLIQIVMTLDNQYNVHNIIYPILLIIHIEAELNQINKENLALCVWHYYYAPKQLMDILCHIIKTPLSLQQLKNYIQNALKMGRNKHPGFNKDNMVFCQQYIKTVDQNPKNSNIFMEILIKTVKHIQQSKQDFKHLRFFMMMAMLCNEPYTLAKYISCAGLRIVRPIRSFLSYAILEEVFQPFSLLEMGRRIFLVLLEADTKQLSFESIIKQQFIDMDLSQDAQIYQYTPPQQTIAFTFESVMWKSSQAFRKKKQVLKLQVQSGGKISKQFENKQEKEEKIKKMFLGIEQEQKQHDPSDYIFSDSDNQNTQTMQIRENSAIRKQRFDLTFYPKVQRNAIFQSVKFKRPSSLYKTIQNIETSYRPNNRSKLFISTRHKNKSTLVPNKKSQNLKFKNTKNQFPIIQQQHIDPVPTLKVSFSHDYSENQISSPFPYRHQLKIEDKDFKTESRAESSHSFAESFQPPTIQIDTEENYSVQNFSGIVKSHDQNTLKIAHQIQHEDSPKVSGISVISADHSDMQGNSVVSGNYQIQVKPVLEQDDQVNGVSSLGPCDFNIYAEISHKFIQENEQSLKSSLAQYNFSSLAKVDDDSVALEEVMKQVYRRNQSKPTLGNALKLLEAMTKKYQVLDFKPELFSLLVKAQQIQAKIIPDIPYASIVSEDTLFTLFHSDKQIFDEFSKKLNKIITSQNIYTITKFIKRVFDNPSFEQEILWDFVMILCQKIDTFDKEQKQMNYQKISATLPKIDTIIWNNKFDNFRKKVFESNSFDELIQIFCEEIKKKQRSQQSINFLNRVQAIYDSDKIIQTLNYINNY